MRVLYNYKNMYFEGSLIFLILMNQLFTWVITVYAEVFIPIKYWHLWCLHHSVYNTFRFPEASATKEGVHSQQKKMCQEESVIYSEKILISRICQFKPISRMDKVKNILITKFVYLTNKQTDTLWKRLLSELR